VNKRYIFPECFLDQELLLLLGVTRKQINKATDIADVMKKFGQEVYRDSKAVGFVDLNETNSQPSRLQKFQDVREQDDLIWKQGSESKHILIVVRPRLEDWIYKAAHSVGINPAQSPYHLPKSAKDLHDNITAKRNVRDNERVMNFLKDVVEKNPSPIQTLRTWITEIQLL
jgi:hypothetical protein